LDFWEKLSELANILELIYKAQIMLESNYSTLAKVILYWHKLEYNLKGLVLQYLSLYPILVPGRLFNKRLNTQTKPIYWAAFLLDPTSILYVLNTKGQENTKH
jgi:hypothetical protein